MLNILTREEAHEIPVPQPIEFVEQSEPGDFELVLGRRQLASVLFVATVLIAMFSAVSYLAGKSYTPPPKVIERVEIRPVPAPPAPAAAVKPEPPVFADPRNGALYLQMGAVEKGIAVVFVDGLRKKGFDAFVAPGPNDHIFRVLIGPLDDPPAYQRVKQSVDQLGLSTFARKYQQ